MKILSLLYTLTTFLPVIISVGILVTSIASFIKKEDEKIISNIIWFGYSVLICILYFVLIYFFNKKCITTPTTDSFILLSEKVSYLIDKIGYSLVSLIYSLTFSTFILNKENKKDSLFIVGALTALPAIFYIIYAIFN